MARRARQRSGDDWLWSYVDILLLSFFAICSFALIALASINPPAKDAPDLPPPGSIAVLVCWPAGSIDVDLWTDGPGQKVPTGYTTKSGLVWSLLRDDLGTTNDSGPANCESAFARITPAGEYVVNVHGYAVPADGVTVHAEVSLNGRLLVSRDVELRPKQERTVVRFTLDGEGQVTGSSEVYKGLRSAGK